MQNRYTGDVGDFGKYGLLRWIVQQNEPKHLRLGIHWYLAAPENNNDGGSRVRRYLDENDEYRDCDPELYAFLQTIQRRKVRQGGELPRAVATIQQSGILPSTTSFFDDLLTFRHFAVRGKGVKQQRVTYRKAWHTRAMNKMAPANLVFLDPDNGLERKSTKSHHARGPKYIYFDELDAFVNRKQTTIVYQHANMERGGFTNYLRQLMSTMSRRYAKKVSSPCCCLYRPHGPRAFIVLPIGVIGKHVVKRTTQIATHPAWSHFFSIL